jgi:hypothetical protein
VAKDSTEAALARFVLGMTSKVSAYEALLSYASGIGHSEGLRALGTIDLTSADTPVQRLDPIAEQLGLHVPSHVEAARILALHISRQLVEGSIDPFDGARDLAEISRAVESPQFHDLDAFVYAESEAEDRPEDREFFRREILKEARRWINQRDSTDAL